MTQRTALGELPPTASHWVIDSLDSGIARLETPETTFIEISRDWLPFGVQEGDVLEVRVHRSEDGAVITCVRDEAETSRRKDEAGKLLERLRKRDPGGDINL